MQAVRSNVQGFSVIEMITAVAILVIVSLFSFAIYRNYLGESRTTEVINAFKAIELEVRAPARMEGGLHQCDNSLVLSENLQSEYVDLGISSTPNDSTAPDGPQGYAAVLTVNADVAKHGKEAVAVATLFHEEMTNQRPGAVFGDVVTDAAVAFAVRLSPAGEPYCEVTTPGAIVPGGNPIVSQPPGSTGTPPAVNTLVGTATGGNVGITSTVAGAVTNTSPVADDDQVTVVQDSSGKVISVLANDTDADGDTMTVTSATASHGMATTNGTTVTYIPNAGFYGSDSVSYEISDGRGGTASASAAVTVTRKPNTRPVAVDDALTVAQDSGAQRVIVLSNDSDSDGDSLTLRSATATHGTVTWDATTVTYKPDPGFFGSDTVTYAITDGRPGGSASARIAVTVTRKPDTAPVADDDQVTVAQDSSGKVISVLANDTDADGDMMTVTSATASHGAATTNGTTVTYVPSAGFYGSDSVSYQISDGRGGTASASVAVTVTRKPNTRPVAVDDALTVAQDSGAQGVSVLSNDNDPDGDRLTLRSATATHGTVTRDATTVTYKPDPGFFGSDTVTYAITDGRPGGSASARVVVTVTRKPNTRPTAVNDRLNVEQDSGGYAVAVLSNDKDADGDPLKVNSVRANHGSVTTNGTTVTYAPNRGYHGGDTITYSITDGRGGAASGSVAVTVRQSAASVAQEAAKVAQSATNSCRASCNSIPGKGRAHKQCLANCGNSCRTACSSTYPGNSNAYRSCAAQCN